QRTLACIELGAAAGEAAHNVDSGGAACSGIFAGKVLAGQGARDMAGREAAVVGLVLIGNGGRLRGARDINALEREKPRAQNEDSRKQPEGAVHRTAFRPSSRDMMLPDGRWDTGRGAAARSKRSAMRSPEAV